MSFNVRKTKHLRVANSSLHHTTKLRLLSLTDTEFAETKVPLSACIPLLPVITGTLRGRERQSKMTGF